MGFCCCCCCVDYCCRPPPLLLLLPPLQEDIQRGYFDDFRDFRDSKGKVFLAPERLVPAARVRCAAAAAGCVCAVGGAVEGGACLPACVETLSPAVPPNIA